MSTPHGLYYLFAALMLAVAGYGAILLALSVSARRTAGRDVDISHAFMGVAMAGMFVPTLAFGPSSSWELIFGALLLWFAVRSVQSVRRYGPHVPHASVHALMSLAMILMYQSSSDSGSFSGSMSMAHASAGSHLDSGLGAPLALVFLGSAIFTLASPNKGASHHGIHLPAYAMSGAEVNTVPLSPHGGPDSPAGHIEMRIALPWLEDLSHVVMCIGMAFMLILMS